MGFTSSSTPMQLCCILRLVNEVLYGGLGLTGVVGGAWGRRGAHLHLVPAQVQLSQAVAALQHARKRSCRAVAQGIVRQRQRLEVRVVVQSSSERQAARLGDGALVEGEAAQGLAGRVPRV